MLPIQIIRPDIQFHLNSLMTFEALVLIAGSSDRFGNDSFV